MRPIPAAMNAGGGGGTAMPMGSSLAGRVGFFGKLPGRGDFVRRDLPNAFVDTWDVWVQHGMEASRATLGEGWLDAWLCAPIWRFAVPGGVCGADAWAGVMMPSVDRAGRYFPLTLAAMAPPGVSSVAMLAGDWIVAVEAAALSALGEDTDFDRFSDAVASLPAFPAMRAESWAGGWRARGTAGDPAALAVALAVAGGSAALGTHCVFATNGGGRVAPAAWVLPGLPPHRAFISLIDDLEAGGVPPPRDAVSGAVPAGMAVPLWIAGEAPVPPLPVADTALGHAAGLFGSDYATDAPPSLPGEPPGGAFDRMFDDAGAQAMGDPAAGALHQPVAPVLPPAATAGAAGWSAFDQPAGAAPAMPPAPPGGADMPAWDPFAQPAGAASAMPPTLPPGADAAAWDAFGQAPGAPPTPPASADAVPWDAFDRAPGATPAMAPAPPASVDSPHWGAFDQPVGPAPVMPPAAAADVADWDAFDQPAGTAASAPAVAPAGVGTPADWQAGAAMPAAPAAFPDVTGESDDMSKTEGLGAGPHDAVATQPSAGHEKGVTLTPRDLFGDTADDVPPVPGGDLFGHKDHKDPA